MSRACNSHFRSAGAALGCAALLQTKFGPVVTHFPPTLAELGQIWLSFGQAWAGFAQVRQFWVKFGRYVAEIGRMLLGLSPNLGEGQERPEPAIKHEGDILVAVPFSLCAASNARQLFFLLPCGAPRAPPQTKKKQEQQKHRPLRPRRPQRGPKEAPRKGTEKA